MLCTQVVEFHPDQTIIETTRTPEQLNLQPRDISIFATNKLGVQAQRATITPRNGAVLFRTEIAKAIIYKDRAVLFHSRCAIVSHNTAHIQALMTWNTAAVAAITMYQDHSSVRHNGGCFWPGKSCQGS